MDPQDKQFPSVLPWGLIQLLLLAIGASGFPLWAHHPFPRESLAFQELLVSQVVFFACLFPVLVGSRWGLAIAIALMLPMDQLAGLISNADQRSIWVGFGCVSLWVIGLGGIRLAVRSPQAHIVVSAVAISFTVGGAVLDYLRWELAASNSQPSVFLPISLLALLCRSGETPSASLWIQAALSTVALTVTMIIRLSISRHTSRLLSSSTSLHSSS